jgi:hypothetical protein
MHPDGPFLTVVGAVSVSLLGVSFGIDRVASGGVVGVIVGAVIVVAAALVLAATVLYLSLPVDDRNEQ